MESMKQTSTFRYHPVDSEGETEFSGLLEIYAHHARNIHNICIYDNQDVYSKFSLTYNPDEMVSTRVIIGGGKNPKFNEMLEIKVNQRDAILKCEIWMLSRAKNLMEDQLLGFALVPISCIVSQGGKISCQDFSLSSTDLFHSPAGIVQLSLTFSSTKHSSVYPLNSSVFPLLSSVTSKPNSSIASEVVLLNTNDYSRVEFPDINSDAEDRMIVSEYLNSNCNRSFGSFLHLGSASRAEDDHEMMGSSLGDNGTSPSHQNCGVLSSTTTSLSDDRNTLDSNSIEHMTLAQQELDVETGVKQSHGDDHPNSEGGRRENVNEVHDGKKSLTGYGDMGPAFSNPVGNVDMEAEQTTMQQQIVDMYMKSMHQFTESLAKMKLPMDLNPNSDSEDEENMIRLMEMGSKLEIENMKKDASRVFYGSRAFF